MIKRAIWVPEEIGRQPVTSRRLSVLISQNETSFWQALENRSSGPIGVNLHTLYLSSPDLKERTCDRRRPMYDQHESKLICQVEPDLERSEDSGR